MFLMVANLGCHEIRIELPRILLLALFCLALNTALFINLYDVINSAGEFFNQLFVPGLSSLPDPTGRFVDLGSTLFHPYWTAMLDCRLVLWLVLTVGGVHVVWRTSQVQGRSAAYHILLLAIVVVGTAIQWRLSSQGAYTHRWWPMLNVEGAVSYWLGPTACVCFIAITVGLVWLLGLIVNDRHLHLRPD
jgi:hypothetical protein